MIQHHPETHLLVEYATGSLQEGPAIPVACHIAMCETCRSQVEAIEAVGGDAFAEIEAAPVSPATLDATLARLDEGVPAPARGVDPETRRSMPSPLWAYLGDGVAALRWRRVTPILSSIRLQTGDLGHKVELLKIAAGRAVPRHTHKGDELTLVLSGGFTDDTGHYGKGDFAFADGERVHQPRADQGEDCIALAVLDAPVVPTSALHKLLHPFLRM